MPHFGSKSRRNLSSCHKDLQRLMNEVIKYFDCTILEGHRTKQRQDELYNSHPQRTKVKWPHSRHNHNPSLAVDVVPYPLIWPNEETSPETYTKDLGRMYMLVGYILGVADQLGIKIRVGADWDGDKYITDQSFDDLPHIELILDASDVNDNEEHSESIINS